ncbi:MAG: hypothetical protein IJV81_02615 [Paludibacteraceae bacterium]|nr:hypothetical protein [Paludibacteraceae bacterium]
MNSTQLIIQNAITQLCLLIKSSSLANTEKTTVVERVHAIDVVLLERLCQKSSRPLTTTNLSYIICFLAGLSTHTVAAIFKIEPGTVYTVRYRLHAYFTTDAVLPF